MAQNAQKEIVEITAILEKNPAGLSRGQITENLNIFYPFKDLAAPPRQ